MLSAAFCQSKAEECELFAAEATRPGEAREWLWMANEWRLAATLDDQAAPASDERRQRPG